MIYLHEIHEVVAGLGKDASLFDLRSSCRFVARGNHEEEYQSSRKDA